MGKEEKVSNGKERGMCVKITVRYHFTHIPKGLGPRLVLLDNFHRTSRLFQRENGNRERMESVQFNSVQTAAGSGNVPQSNI